MPYGRDVSPRAVSPGPSSGRFVPEPPVSAVVTPRRVMVASGGASSKEAVDPPGVFRETITRPGGARDEEGEFASYTVTGGIHDPLSQAAAEQRAEMQKIIEGTRRQRPSVPGSASSERKYLQVSHTLDHHPIRERRYDLASRLGIMTIEKVAEIEKTLLERFEDTLIAKVAFIAGCFHSWRCEATLYRTSRKVQDEVARLQEEWRAHMSVQLSEHMTDREKQNARWRQGIQLALGRWALGEEQGLIQRALRAWRDWLQIARQRERNKQAIKSALLAWAEGKDIGGLRMCVQLWAAEARADKVLKQHQEEYKQAELARQAEWSAHLSVQANAHMSAREQEKARWRQGMALAIDRWAHGALQGLIHRLFEVWRELLVSAKRQRKSKPLVLRVMHQWLEGRDKGNLHACYKAWKDSVTGMKSEEAQRQLKLALEDNARLQEIADTQRKEVIARSLRNLGFQSTKMALLESFLAWSKLYQEAKEQWHREMERNEVLKRYALIVEQTHMKKDAASLKSSVMLEWHKAAHFSKLEKLHGEHVDSLASKEAAMSQKWQQGIRLALDRWALDDVHGLTHRVMRAWRDWLSLAKRHRQSKDLIMSNMLKWAEGKDRGSLHSCFRMWAAEAHAMKELARHQEEYRRAELKMQEDWAAQLSMQSGDHMTAKQQQEARWKQSMALALERWALGSQHGLILRVVQAWRDLHRNECKRKPLIQSAMLSWAEGKDKGNLRMCMQVWACETTAAKELAALRSDHDGAKAAAQKAQEEKWRQGMVLALDRWALGADKGLLQAVFQAWRDAVGQAKNKRKSKPLIQNVMHQWCEGKEKGVLHMCFKAWRDSVAGIRSVEAQRKLDLALADNARLQELAATQKREVIAKSLRSLGFQNERMSMMECFLAWSAFYQEAREEWHRKMEQNSALEKYALILEQTHLKKDAASLKAAVMLEWHKCARHMALDREHGEHIAQHQQTMVEAEQEIQHLRLHQVSLEEQLQSLYMQLDQVTETLQTELRSKEDLAAELRQAYARWHHASLPTSPMLFGGTINSSGAGDRLDRSENVMQTDASSGLNRSRSTGSIQRPAQATTALTTTSRLASAVGTRHWESSNINFSRASDLDGTDHFTFPKPFFTETVRTPRQPAQVFREELTRASTTASVGQTPTKATTTRASTTPRSPPQCSWDATVARLQDEGILRLDDRRL